MTEIETRATERARNLPPRDARGRFAVLPGAATKTAHVAPAMRRDASVRVRSLPSRDARGRFVALPTTSAPSWYVFCADGYRVPGDIEVMAMAVDSRPAPQPLPSARVVRRRRPAMEWEAIAAWILIAVFVVAVGWQLFHLQLPHH